MNASTFKALERFAAAATAAIYQLNSEGKMDESVQDTLDTAHRDLNYAILEETCLE